MNAAGNAFFRKIPRMKRNIQTESGKTAIDLLGWSCRVFQHLPFGTFKNPSNAQFAMV